MFSFSDTELFNIYKSRKKIKIKFFLGGGFGSGGGGFGNGGGGGFGNGSGGGGYGGRGPAHIVHMRGLPFRVTENDIAEWFSSVVDPVDISIIFNNQGRPTGEADVMFSA